MTILPNALTLSSAAAQNAAALADAAAAAAALLPAASPLTPTNPVPGTAATAMGFAGAAIATFEGSVNGSVAVLVGPDLVEALATSPLGSLDLAAAAQPALDAAAAALGARVGAARTVTTDLIINDLGHPFTVVPLAGAGVPGTSGAALLVNDGSLEAAAAAAAAASAVAATAAMTAGGGAPGFGSAGGPGGALGGALGGTLGGSLGGSLGQPGAHGSGASSGAPLSRGLEMLHGVIMDVTVELGRTRMSVRELLALTPGTVLELDRAAGSPADLLVNGRLIARGEVVVIDEDFGLRVTEIVDDAAPGASGPIG